ncbi:long-chain acyl-CoA synthetase [Edaphobacter modestus]|uniref:Long-chain acyl-CoA synthetase n=1 Tax=Edaphobacter modestus TaxID=388466 RepID=A0A4Q7Z0Z5_9BACT|nr:long-chain acyl-CoA synthetase [Edaphobacter modestus]
MEDFRRHAAEAAVVAHRGNRRYATTYGELAELAGRSAAELDRRGIAPGERVVLWGENSAEWLGVFFGCLLRGVIAVPLDAAGSNEFANRVVKDVSPKLIVGDRGRLASMESDVPRLLFSEVNVRLPATPMFAVSDAIKGETPFQIIFTSGTTAEPKGIVLTHRNVLASLEPIEAEISKYLKYERWVHPLRFLHTLPLSHVFGQFMGMWVPPLLAAEVHFGEQLEPSRMTELIQRERISVLVTVPRVLHLLRTHLLARYGSLAGDLERAKDLSVWKRWWRFQQVHRALGWKFWAVISGGATLPADLEDFWNRLGFALIQGYGMTETTALVTLNHPFRIGHGTIGKPLPGREVRISDDGEILVRGDMLAAATWQGGTLRQREGEWLATGDLAAKDESGELRFLGRKGEVIVTGAGMNVHPADLEEAVTKLPGVRGCVVVPCETISGPEPVAVVLFSGSDSDLDVLVGQANRGLAEHQHIRRALRWPHPQFPYTSTGKLLRRELAEWVCATLSGASGVAEGADVVLNMIAEITGESLSGANDQLRLSEDLHLDSLGRVQLQSALEQRLGLELEDDAIVGVETLGDLRALMDWKEGTASQAAGTSAEAGPAPVSPADVPAAVSLPQMAFPKERDASEHVFPRWPWGWPIHAIRVAFLELVMRPLIWVLAAPRIVRETPDLPLRPVLVIANHVTAYDGALILYALPARLRRRVAIAMSGEVLMDLRKGRNQQSTLRNLLAPAGYWLVTALFNVFPLPRLRGFRKSFAHAGETMDRGYSVLIFPEGTRSPDGLLHPFRPGIGLLAQQSRVPVVPVALIGLGEMRGGKTRWFRSGQLEVHVGEAVAVEEGGAPAQLTARLEESVRRLRSKE